MYNLLAFLVLSTLYFYVHAYWNSYSKFSPVDNIIYLFLAIRS